MPSPGYSPVTRCSTPGPPHRVILERGGKRVWVWIRIMLMETGESGGGGFSRWIRSTYRILCPNRLVCRSTRALCFALTCRNLWLPHRRLRLLPCRGRENGRRGWVSKGVNRVNVVWLRIYSVVVVIIVGKLNTTSSSDSSEEFFLFCWLKLSKESFLLFLRIVFVFWIEKGFCVILWIIAVRVFVLINFYQWTIDIKGMKKSLTRKLKEL